MWFNNLNRLWLFILPGLSYLARWHQVKRVEQEKTEALDEEHVVAVLPDQEEGEGGGTHGKIAKHLQSKTVNQWV